MCEDQEPLRGGGENSGLEAKKPSRASRSSKGLPNKIRTPENIPDFEIRRLKGYPLRVMTRWKQTRLHN